jgi:hypothetical protein
MSNLKLNDCKNHSIMSKAVKTATKKAKKKAVQKARTPKKSQPVDLRRAIFQKLRAILSAYSPPLAAILDVGARYELVSEKEVEWAGRYTILDY